MIEPADVAIAVMLHAVPIGFVMGTPDGRDGGFEVRDMPGGGILFSRKIYQIISL
jgi:hypothetical protein